MAATTKEGECSGGAFACGAESAEFWSLSEAVAITAWPPALASLSFRTSVVPLSRADCDAVLSASSSSSSSTSTVPSARGRGRGSVRARGRGGRASAPSSLASASEPTLASKGRGHPTPQSASTTNAREACLAMEARLDESIRGFGETGAFVKLDSRSPKDSVLLSVPSEGRERIFQCLDSMNFSTTDTESQRENKDFIAFLKAASSLMMVNTGRQAMLRLFGESSRVEADLKKALEFSSNSAYPVSVIVREFVKIEPHQEFRVFISNRKLTAVSQYFHFCLFEHFSPDLEERIKQFFESSLKENLPAASCIADIVVTETSVMLIELNPFHRTTDSCLFDWANDADFNLLTNGPFQLRIRTTPHLHKLSAPTPWQKLINLWHEAHEI
ncbi:D123 protein [Pelomyxa schiedti]|nr:D123 protein [Pelomyxa schiedti]